METSCEIYSTNGLTDGAQHARATVDPFEDRYNGSSSHTTDKNMKSGVDKHRPVNDAKGGTDENEEFVDGLTAEIEVKTQLVGGTAIK